MTKRPSPPHYLRYWRKHRGWTQEYLARRVPCHPSTVSKWENDEQSISDQADQVAAALGIHPVQLLYGPQAAISTTLPPGSSGFNEDASPWTEDIPGIRLSLGDAETPYLIETDVLSRARGEKRLMIGDIAIFDIGAAAMKEFNAGQYPDGTVVIAQAHDDGFGDAVTIVRQWIGDHPGLLITNRPDQNEVVNLQQHGEISVLGVLTRLMRSWTPRSG